MEGEEEILARFDRAAAAEKAWTGKGNWRSVELAGGTTQLTRVIGLSIAGVVVAGLQARLVCRAELPEMDLYAHLEMHIPEVSCYGHFQRVSWRPLRPHTNSANAPSHLRLRTLTDRCEPLALNRHLGVQGLRQIKTSIAEPMPPALADYRAVVSFLQDFWRIPSLDQLSDPP